MKNKKNIRILGFIPARGGSKGVYKKNIRLVNGKPLLAYSIENALGSKYIDRVVVSTDDAEIADVSRRYGAVVIPRPKKISGDKSPTYDAIFHAVDWLKERNEDFNVVVVIEPTSPLRKNDDLDNAITLFLKNISIADSLVSVGEIHLENPYLAKIIEKGYVRPLIQSKTSFSQRQQLPKIYFPYGVIYLSKIEQLKKYKTFYQKRTIPYFIERWQNYEIDDFYDYLCIDRITKQLSMKTVTYPNASLQGKMIRLEEFTEKHLHDPNYYTWLQDKEVVEMIGRPDYLTAFPFCIIEDYVMNVKSSSNAYFFALYFKKNARFIGTVKLGSIDWQNRSADVGILIGDKQYWGKGISKDAVLTVSLYAFEKLGMRKLTGGCLSTNIAMRRCFERVGFMKEAVLRKKVPFKGKFVDHILYGVFKDELVGGI
jgi:CMP-N-acetylneuraminic acid synthetase/RimJ/RimL family protein N-acetyltransferase